MPRFDREDGTAVAPGEQVAHHRGAEALGPVGCADHGNRGRAKQAFEIAYGHYGVSGFLRAILEHFPVRVSTFFGSLVEPLSRRLRALYAFSGKADGRTR